MDTLSREFKQINPDKKGIPKDNNSSIGGRNNIRQKLLILQPEFLQQRNLGRVKLGFQKTTNIHSILPHEVTNLTLLQRAVKPSDIPTIN